MAERNHIYKWGNSLDALKTNTDCDCFREYHQKPAKYLQIYFLENEFLLDDIKYILRNLKLPGLTFTAQRTTIGKISHKKDYIWGKTGIKSVITVTVTGAEYRKITSVWYRFFRYVFETNRSVLIMKRAIELLKYRPNFSLFQYLIFCNTTYKPNNGHSISYSAPLVSKKLQIPTKKHFIINIKNVNYPSLTVQSNKWDNDINVNYENFKKLLIK